METFNTVDSNSLMFPSPVDVGKSEVVLKLSIVRQDMETLNTDVSNSLTCPSPDGRWKVGGGAETFHRPKDMETFNTVGCNSLTFPSPVDVGKSEVVLKLSIVRRTWNRLIRLIPIL